MRILRSPDGATELKRVAALVALLGVLFLPLHFHSLIASPKLGKECVCMQGSRTVAALAPAPVVPTPVLNFQTLAFATGEKYERFSASTVCIRAPPVIAVL
jgi:hypothetical protein